MFPTEPIPEDDAELLNELKRVRSEITWRRWVRRRIGIIAIFIAMDLLASLAAGVALYKVFNFQSDACHADNELRRQYVDQWTPLLRDSPQPVDPGPNAPEAARETFNGQVKLRQEFTDGLTHGFAQHPC